MTILKFSLLSKIWNYFSTLVVALLIQNVIFGKENIHKNIKGVPRISDGQKSEDEEECNPSNNVDVEDFSGTEFPLALVQEQADENLKGTEHMSTEPESHSPVTEDAED